MYRWRKWWSARNPKPIYNTKPLVTSCHYLPVQKAKDCLLKIFFALGSKVSHYMKTEKVRKGGDFKAVHVHFLCTSINSKSTNTRLTWINLLSIHMSSLHEFGSWRRRGKLQSTCQTEVSLQFQNTFFTPFRNCSCEGQLI